jgi:hypothetical protein
VGERLDDIEAAIRAKRESIALRLRVLSAHAQSDFASFRSGVGDHTLGLLGGHDASADNGMETASDSASSRGGRLTSALNIAAGPARSEIKRTIRQGLSALRHPLRHR